MKQNKSPYPLIIMQSGLIWSAIPVMWSYLSAYYQENGFSATQIGILMAINPMIAIIFQPLLGMQADRARSKNALFAVLMAGSIIATFFLPMSTSYIYAIGVLVILSFFQVSLSPISESISLESLEHLNKSYAPSRMAGTLGYSVTAILFGYLMGINTDYLFYAAMVLSLIHIVVILKMPHVKGHQTRESRVPFRILFEDRYLILFFVFASVAALLMSFFYTFLPIYFLDLGGSSDQLGIVFFLGAISEIPFLLFADRIIRKIGNQVALLISMFATGLRILLLVFVTSPAQIFPIALTNGLAFIIFNYVIAVYINRTVRKELRTTGQTVLAVSMGVGRIIGTLLGGYLIDAIGMDGTNILSFILSAVAMFGFVLAAKRIKRTAVVKNEPII